MKEGKEGKEMKIAIEEAIEGVERGEGGPFGAVIIKRDSGEVVARAHNMVLQTNDPTAHAEVTCIRKACARLGRFNLADCDIYSSCEPCPMCFGAIYWAGLGKCHYSSKSEVAAKYGFSDAHIYKVIRGEETDDNNKIDFIHSPDPRTDEVFKKSYSLY